MEPIMTRARVCSAAQARVAKFATHSFAASLGQRYGRDSFRSKCGTACVAAGASEPVFTTPPRLETLPRLKRNSRFQKRHLPHPRLEQQYLRRLQTYEP